ncbi:MAG: hypothetical protein QW734_11280 [Candidatus Bathyarchaeia archaeon]
MKVAVILAVMVVMVYLIAICFTIPFLTVGHQNPFKAAFYGAFPLIAGIILTLILITLMLAFHSLLKPTYT